MRIFVILSAAAAAIALSACNTISGMGRDVQAAGRVVTSTADDARR